MKKFLDWLEKVLGPVASAISRNKYLIAIRDGFLFSVPMLIAGSVFLLLANFPIVGFKEFVAGFLGENWNKMLAMPAAASFDIMAILAVFGIGYSLAKQFKVDPPQAAIVSIVAFFIVTPQFTNFSPEGMADTVYVVKSLPIKWMGSNGLFLGMISAIVATRLFVLFVQKG